MPLSASSSERCYGQATKLCIKRCSRALEDGDGSQRPQTRRKVVLEHGKVSCTIIAETREHLRQGSDSCSEDEKIVTGGLGFDLNDIPGDQVA